MSKSPILFSSDDEGNDLHQETEVLKKFQTMLQGVPPPSSVTISKLNVSDMLAKYQENENSFGMGSQNLNASQKSFVKTNTTPLVYYLNSSQTSEDIASISQKVQSRYIYSETLSSCNIWFDSAVKTNSARKRSGRRNGFGLSPGSRLSHLARRRQIFSCENLQQLANSEKRRHIEIKKQDALKNRSFERNKTVNNEKNNSFKRALFLSPDDDKKKKTLTSEMIKRNLFPSSGKEKNENNKNVGSSTHQSHQRYAGGSSKKRKRTESKDGNGTWPRRALTFTEEEPDRSQEKKNAKVMKEIELSIHHKSKLLWAVATTLKEKNMCSKDPQFKTCAAALFMICRKNLGKIINSKTEGGTSEKMLHFARQQIGGIFEKLGISNDTNSDLVVKPTNQNNDQKCENQKDESSTNSTKENSYGCELVCSNETAVSGNKLESAPSEITENQSLQTCINEKENIVLPGNSNRIS